VKEEAHPAMNRKNRRPDSPLPFVSSSMYRAIVGDIKLKKYLIYLFQAVEKIQWNFAIPCHEIAVQNDRFRVQFDRPDQATLARSRLG